jgi:hypothetical protein
MTWYAAFRCLNCEHAWREPAPADAWEMVRCVAGPAACPLCGAKMQDGQMELLSHSETKIALLRSTAYAPFHAR